jgi:hypothetical protein
MKSISLLIILILSQLHVNSQHLNKFNVSFGVAKPYSKINYLVAPTKDYTTTINPSNLFGSIGFEKKVKSKSSISTSIFFLHNSTYYKYSLLNINQLSGSYVDIKRTWISVAVPIDFNYTVYENRFFKINAKAGIGALLSSNFTTKVYNHFVINNNSASDTFSFFTYYSTDKKPTSFFINSNIGIKILFGTKRNIGLDINYLNTYSSMGDYLINAEGKNYATKQIEKAEVNYTIKHRFLTFGILYYFRN